MDAALASLCRQTVTIAPRTGSDRFNQGTYGAAMAYSARVSGERRYILNDAGEEVLVRTAVYLAGNPAIGARDRLTLSTQDTNSTEAGVLNPTVVSVERRTDDLGRISTVIYTA